MGKPSGCIRGGRVDGAIPAGGLACDGLPHEWTAGELVARICRGQGAFSPAQEPSDLKTNFGVSTPTLSITFDLLVGAYLEDVARRRRCDRRASASHLPPPRRSVLDQDAG